ncbi:MAG TPA: VWA domain-containing protein [Vicinamibacterales bacterium]
MPVSIDFTRITFAEPAFLWLLSIPLVLAAVWFWRLVRRRVDIGRLSRSRTLPVRERYAVLGDLPFWLCLLASSAFLIVALARPHGPATAVRQGGLDLVILQDGSASMRVKDVAGDRWQRSVRFLRTIGDSLSWNDDRIALALFAHIAAPQIRLTKDPNTFFFFLDHLDREPPFRINDATTWDTNLELGIYWGLRVIERDEEIHGKNSNAKLFVLVSDGEAWSGKVATSLKKAQERNVPIYVVGVGTLAGGRLPEFHDEKGEVVNDPEVPTTAHLDRSGLQHLAVAGGGQYFELDRDGDRHIANAIIDAGKKMAPSLGAVQQSEDLYWRFLVIAAVFPFIGLPFLRDRPELWILAIGAAAVLIGISAILV